MPASCPNTQSTNPWSSHMKEVFNRSKQQQNPLPNPPPHLPKLTGSTPSLLPNQSPNLPLTTRSSPSNTLSLLGNRTTLFLNPKRNRSPIPTNTICFLQSLSTTQPQS